MHDSLYQQIDGEMIRETALRTKGSGGPSGVDANGFKRILACKSFKKSGVNLCEAVATMTRRLCTEYIDPRTIEPILANRLIPLDKGEGAVRPIGVGEVIRRIVGKPDWKIGQCRHRFFFGDNFLRPWMFFPNFFAPAADRIIA